MPLSNLIAVRNWVNFETSKPVQMSEMQVFWKALTDEEKNQFGREALEMLAKNGQPVD